MDPPDNSTILYSASINDDFPEPVLRTRKRSGQFIITHTLPSNDADSLAFSDRHGDTVEYIWQPRTVAHVDIAEFNGTSVRPLRWRLFKWYFMCCLLRNSIFARILHNFLQVKIEQHENRLAHVFRQNSYCSSRTVTIHNHQKMKVLASTSAVNLITNPSTCDRVTTEGVKYLMKGQFQRTYR